MQKCLENPLLIIPCQHVGQEDLQSSKYHETVARRQLSMKKIQQRHANCSANAITRAEVQACRREQQKSIKRLEKTYESVDLHEYNVPRTCQLNLNWSSHQAKSKQNEAFDQIKQQYVTCSSGNDLDFDSLVQCLREFADRLSRWEATYGTSLKCLNEQPRLVCLVELYELRPSKKP
jgi:hypothetical protein